MSLIDDEIELLHDNVASIDWPEKPSNEKLKVVINYRFEKNEPCEDEDPLTEPFPIEIWLN